MRLVVLGFVGFSLASALPAATAAQGPVSAAPLAPTELLLEVNALGTARSQANLATFQAHISCPGATEAEARAARDQAVQRVTAAALSIGIAPEDVVAREIPADADFALMMAAEGMSEGADELAAPAQHVARSTMEIRLRDVRRVEELKTAFRAAGASRISGPSYSLSEDRAARRLARGDAIATARADAEAYATGLGMRVARMVRITERTGFDSLSLLMNNASLMRRLQSGQSESDQVETHVIIGVDFVLAPQ